MPNQIPKSLQSERVSRLTELETELRSEYFGGLVDQNVQMMIESESQLTTIGSESEQRVLRGTTCRYAPAELISDDPNFQVSKLANVRVVGSDGTKLAVEPV